MELTEVRPAALPRRTPVKHAVLPQGLTRRAIVVLGNISIFLLLLLMFFFSGASALMFEVVWTRLLSLVFGVTLYAISAVLASFMAGLALGSYLVGRLADRVRWPLLYYAGMEIAIGLSALASLRAIDALTPMYVGLYEASGGNQGFVTIVRFAAACGVMLVPTALMGATLPFMVRASLLHLSKVGENISLLYAVNTAGAASGALAAGFFLIGGVGLQATVSIGAALNIGIGAMALVLSVLSRRAVEAEERRAAQALAHRPRGIVWRRGRGMSGAGAPSARETSGVAAAVLFGIGASGFCALAYEVIWFRILDLFLNGTTYAFTVMLVTFLGGLAAGSALTRVIIGWKWNWAAVLGLLQLGIGLVALLSLPMVVALPVARDLVAGTPSLPFLDSPVLAMGLVAALVLLPLALLLGMTFPIAAQALARIPGKEGAHIGSLNASNTLGAIGGSLAGGLWLVPTLGSQHGMLLLATVNLGLGLLLLWVAFSWRPWLRVGLPPIVLGFLWLLAGSGTDIYPQLYPRLFKGNELLWHEEGIENTVSVQRHPEGYLVMYLNSRGQAEDAKGTMRFHQLIGQLGMVLHPEPRDVLVIGLGGGATPGAISRFEDTSVDVVELSHAVVRAASLHFPHINNDLLNQPNVSLKIDDGRNHLLLTDKRYDLITADIIQAHHAGSGNLYSLEYFTLARRALKKGGLMVQWTNSSQAMIHAPVVRTFAEVFPGATVWYGGQLLVGSTAPQVPNAVLETMNRRLEDPAVRAALPDLAEVSPANALGGYYRTIEELVASLPPGPILTDDRPLTEYFRSLPGGDTLERPGTGH